MNEGDDNFSRILEMKLMLEKGLLEVVEIISGWRWFHEKRLDESLCE